MINQIKKKEDGPKLQGAFHYNYGHFDTEGI